MATAADTIKLALRKIRVIGQGANPTTAQQQGALTELNAIINGLVGFGSSVEWRDYPVESAHDIVADYPAQRFLCKAGVTLTLPAGSQARPVFDGMRVGVVDAAGTAATSNITLARNGWKIAGSAANATISTNNASRVYMFRADLGDWKLAADLETGTAIPFPAEFDLPLALILADSLGGEYGQRLSDRDFDLMRGGRARLRNRYCAIPLMYSDAANMGGATANYGISESDWAG